MSSFQNPVGGGPRDPLENPIRVEAIEEEHAKQAPPQMPDSRSAEEKLGVAAFLLQAFRNAVDFFLTRSSQEKPGELTARANLVSLKKSLEVLKKEDRSQDVDFLNQLSKIWRQALDDSLYFQNESVAFKFKILVKKIQHYPENQPHTFGYYLTENANQKWIPFPYMELIQKIHSEHEKNPTSSKLAEWTTILDELVALLKPD